jgi:hypothetical protein
MSKITTLLTIFLLLSPANQSMAHTEQGIINGRVIDSKVGGPLAYVNISIQSVSGEFIAGDYTNEEGYFKIANIKKKIVHCIHSVPWLQNTRKQSGHEPRYQES